MKVYTLAPNENWIVDRMVNEWNLNNSEFVTNNPEKSDLIWLLADWAWNHLPIDLLQSKPVVTTIHHIVPDKFGPQQRLEFDARDKITNVYHCFNTRTANFISTFTSKPIKIIPYWVNDKFWIKQPYKTCRNKFGINDDTFLIGSFQRDTEGCDLISPKLEKGPDIFCDAVENYNHKKNVCVLLGGWRRQYVINRLKQAGIQYLYIERPNLETIRDMYCALDLYIVGSRYEGGPQALLEAPIMKIPTISTPVGIAEQILDSKSINSDLMQAKPSVDKSYNNAFKYCMEFQFVYYKELFKKYVNI